MQQQKTSISELNTYILEKGISEKNMYPPIKSAYLLFGFDIH